MKQKIYYILKYSKADIAVMLVNVQRSRTEDVRLLKTQITVLEAAIMPEGLWLKGC